MFLLGMAILIPNIGGKLLLKAFNITYEPCNCYFNIYLNSFSVHVHFYSFNQGILFYWYKEMNVSL